MNNYHYFSNLKYRTNVLDNFKIIWYYSGNSKGEVRMNKGIKIKFIAGVTALSLLVGGYTLIKEKNKESQNLPVFTKTTNYANERTCEVSVINASAENREINVVLTDTRGNLIREWTQNNNPYVLDDLREGVYAIKCKSESIDFSQSYIVITSDAYTEIYIENEKASVEYYQNENNNINTNMTLKLTKLRY